LCFVIQCNGECLSTIPVTFNAVYLDVFVASNAYVYKMDGNSEMSPFYVFRWREYEGIPFLFDCLCGIEVRVPGCYPRGSGFDSQRYKIS
jgi:hypothetical protein